MKTLHKVIAGLAIVATITTTGAIALIIDDMAPKECTRVGREFMQNSMADILLSMGTEETFKPNLNNLTYTDKMWCKIASMRQDRENKNKDKQYENSRI